MSFKQHVLDKQPGAKLCKEDLAHNGSYHYTITVPEDNERGYRWLGTRGYHDTPAQAWQGAFYALCRADRPKEL